MRLALTAERLCHIPASNVRSASRRSRRTGIEPAGCAQEVGNGKPGKGEEVLASMRKWSSGGIL